jgi:hypothetical protein
MLSTLLRPPAQGRFFLALWFIPLVGGVDAEQCAFLVRALHGKERRASKGCCIGGIRETAFRTCGNRGDRYDDPFDIASNALGLVIIHGVVP